METDNYINSVPLMMIFQIRKFIIVFEKYFKIGAIRYHNKNFDVEISREQNYNAS